MSSITISWIKNKLSPEEQYKYNKKWLEENFSDVINAIERRLKKLSEKYPALMDLVIDDLQTLKFKKEQYLNLYTVDIARTPYHEKILENWVKDFNNEALNIKRKIAEFVLDTDKKKEALLNLIRELKEIGEPKDEELKKEFIKLKSDLYKLIKEQNFVEAFERILITLPRLKTIKDKDDRKEKIKKHIQGEPKITLRDTSDKLERIYKENEALDKLRLEIKSYIDMIKDLDEDVLKDLQPLIKQVENSTDKGQLESLVEKLKLEYKKLKKKITLTNIYKEDIKNMIEKTTIKEIIEKGKRLLEKKYISNEEFSEFYEEYIVLSSQEKKKKEVIDKLKKSFEELGYKFEEDENTDIKLLKGDITYLDTPLGSEYKLAIKLEGNKLITRFTRLVADERELANLTEYDKIRDVEKAKEWCSDYNRLLTVMEKNGVEMEPKLIVEPNIDKIYYEIATEVYELLRRKKKKEDKQIRQQRKIE